MQASIAFAVEEILIIEPLFIPEVSILEKAITSGVLVSFLISIDDIFDVPRSNKQII